MYKFKMNKCLALLVLTSPLFLAIPAQAEPPVAAASKIEYIQPTLAHEDIGTVKIVVALTSDYPEVAGMKLRNIKNALDDAQQLHGNLQVKVVLYAKGVALLANPLAKTRKTIDTLRSHGVQFVVCNNSLKEQDIDFHRLYGVTEKDIVPSGFLEVAWLQQHKGYVSDSAN